MIILETIYDFFSLRLSPVLFFCLLIIGCRSGEIFPKIQPSPPTDENPTLTAKKQFMIVEAKLAHPNCETCRDNRCWFNVYKTLTRNLLQ